ncbi:MFS transporter [Bacillus sp. sid0103]|uniref:MFS transporter n=1 Tax=Bacillus sp. sid0103 TaxID=2856337 RepID=UPI001C452883|nr:MFS transporter [Bacillus sp. sid0103]MBV7504517.1 MFS transporter [Bacillus sp. sid0103]
MEKQNCNYRWVVFVSVLLTYLLIVSQRTAPGLISDQLMKDFNITASTIGLLASIQFFAYAGLQIPVGILSDRFGPNFFLVIGALLTGLGTLIYSLASNEVVFLFARLMVGMGDSAIWVNLVLILSQWFKVKEFVGLLGVAGMAGSFGFLLATVPLSAWITISGWRAPFFTTGILLVLCSVLLYFVLVQKPKKMSWKSTGANKPKKPREKTLVLLRRIFSTRQAWATFFCHFGVVGTYVGFIGSWAVPYGMHVYGLSRSDASQLIMVGLFGALIGAPLTSWVTSRIDSLKRPYVVVHSIVVLCWASFLLFDGKPPFYLMTILFFIIGFGNGACSLTFAIVRKSFDLKEVGVVSGFANMGGFLSAVLLPGIFGKVLDYFHASESSVGYHYGFMIPVLFSMLGLMGGLIIVERRQEVSHRTQVN